MDYTIVTFSFKDGDQPNNYTIVEYCMMGLQKEIKDYIARGYVPTGGVSVASSPYTYEDTLGYDHVAMECTVSQAMVKE